MADRSYLLNMTLQPEAPSSRAGGGERVRTDDLLVANQALSQLSYTPECPPFAGRRRAFLLVGLGRFELPTSRLSGVRSNRLSYRPFLEVFRRQCKNLPDRLMKKIVGITICGY